MASGNDVKSLAQGIVYWGPPKEALNAAKHEADNPRYCQYGPDEGMPELREALKHKLKEENGLTGYEVMITAGANQAFTNVQLALCDPDDHVLLFSPYYFNHLMAVQMTGGADRLAMGQVHPNTFHPDFDWLETRLSEEPKVKMVVLVNPCNPTGVLLSREELQRCANMCAAAGVWLVVDNTYEHFVYDGGEHFCIPGPNIVHIFSFSKAYGMMGWRVGYIAYPTEDGQEGQLGMSLLKVQDTIPICPPQLSQRVALECVKQGRSWVTDKVKELEPNRKAIIDALSPIGQIGDGNVAGGEGAIYLFVRLPNGLTDDIKVVEWIAAKHGVCVIPGSSCGAPGCFRVAYANLEPETYQIAAQRLKAALQLLVEKGAAALD